MNRKGFTLIEGLLVIAIIGVLLLTLIPSVITIINKNKQKSCETNRDSVIMAARMYVAENKYNLNFSCGQPKQIYLYTLRKYGNLSDVELELDERFPAYIEVTLDCDTKEFAYKYNVNCG